jgi:regulator of nonsense transcripts 2
VLDTLEPILALLRKLVKEDEDTREFANLSLIREFAKVTGIDMLGITARDQTIELIPLSSVVEEGDREIISAEDRQKLMDILKSYHARVSLRLSNQHKKMKRDEKKNYEQEMMRGELSEARAAEFQVVEDEVQRLLRDVKVLSDVLDLDMPELVEDEDEEEAVGSSVSMVGRAEGQVFVDSPFEEEETRVFYERLQELTAMVPSIYFSESGATAAEIAAQAKTDEEQNGEDAETQTETDAPVTERHDEALEDDTIVVEDMIEEDGDEKETEGGAADQGDSPAEAVTQKIVAEQDEVEETSDGGKCDALLARLPNCSSRERMDEWAVEFCYMNTKRNRAKLLMALYLLRPATVRGSPR